MSVKQMFDLIRRYAEERGQPAETMIETLTTVSDEHSIPLKLYGEDLGAESQPRQVLDLQSVSMEMFMGVRKRSIDIKPGVTLLYGPNGSGKTTTMRAILYALFGGAAAGVKAAETLIHDQQSELKVAVSFAGGTVTRTCERKAVKKGARIGQVDVEHNLAVQIAGEKSNKMKEGQTLIDTWLGVDGAFVRRVAFLEQGMLTQLMDEQPARRRELFYRLLSLEPAEETRKALSKILDAEENKRLVNERLKEQYASELDALRHQMKGFSIPQMETELARLAPLIAGQRAAPEDIKAANEAFARRQVDRMNAVKSIDDRRQYLIKLDELQRDPVLSVVFNDVAAMGDEAEHNYQIARESRIKLEAALNAITKRGQDVKSLPPICPTCQIVGKTCDITPQVRESILGTIRGQWVAASKDLEVQKRLESTALTAMSEARRKRDMAAADQSRKKFVEEQIRLLKEAVSKIQHPVDVAAIDADLKAMQEDLKRKHAAGAATVELADYKSLEIELSKGRAIEAQIAALEKKAAQVAGDEPMTEARLQAFRFAVAAFAKDGVPLWLARQHIERINAIASQLALIDSYTYAFGPDLEIVIRRQKKADEPESDVILSPEITSESARQRGAVVLMAALDMYLQELSGLSIPVLWVDELPFQDEANAGLVVDMVKRLTQWYPKVVLCASRWEEYVGQFDNEIALHPEDLTIELDRQRELKKAPAPKKKAPAKTEAVQPKTETSAPASETPAPASETPPARAFVALCDVHASIADLTKISPVKSTPQQCYQCAVVHGDRPPAAHHAQIEAALTSPEKKVDPIAEAEAALAAAPQMDPDLEEDCPF